MKVLRFLFRYAPKFIIAASIIAVIGGIASTAVLAMINDQLRSASGGIEGLWTFLGLCAVILVANMAARLCIAGLSHWSSFDLRMQIGRRWINTPLEELERDGSVKLRAAIEHDVDQLSNSMHILPGLCIDVTVIVTCLIYLGYLSWQMLIVMIAFLVVTNVTRFIPQKRCNQLLADARAHQQDMTAVFNSMTGGVKELKMNIKRWNGFYVGKLYETAAKYRDCRYAAELIFGVIRGYSEILYFLFAAILIYGGPVTGTLSQKVIVGFAVTLLYMKTNIDHVLEFVMKLAYAKIAIENLERLGIFKQSSSLSVAALRSRVARDVLARDVMQDSGLKEDLPTTLDKNIVLEGIEYRYGSERDEVGFAVGPIDLTIASGELLFVIGGNGSGKTTFAKVLCGLYPPTSGRILVDGKPITAETRSWYSQYFGTVFSDSYLFEKLYGGEGLPEEDAAVTEYLKELRLQDKVAVAGGRFSTTALSQGQRKRLALVAAYMEDRPLYLFDEWAADQDPEFRDCFYHGVLQGLRKRGKTVIVISHDDRYYHVADRVVKFENGRLSVLTKEQHFTAPRWGAARAEGQIAIPASVM